MVIVCLYSTLFYVLCFRYFSFVLNGPEIKLSYLIGYSETRIEVKDRRMLWGMSGATRKYNIMNKHVLGIMSSAGFQKNHREKTEIV